MNTRGIYWNLKERNSGPLRSETFHEKDICLPKDKCFIFIISDAAQDGLCCNHSHGYYSIFIENVLIKYSIYSNRADNEKTVFGTSGKMC